MTTPVNSDIHRLRQLRVAALVEGTTLLVLVGIAVPLKHVAGYPTAVALLGPVHGAAFLLYVWLVFNAASDARWRAGETLRLLSAALLPFGALWSIRQLKRREIALLGATLHSGEKPAR